MKQKTTPQWYLILSFGYSVAGIASGLIYLMPQLTLPLTFLFLPIVLLWFVLNLIMVPIMILDKVEPIGLALPLIFMFDTVFSFYLGLTIGAREGFWTQLGATGMGATLMEQFLSLIFLVLALVLSSKLLLRKHQ